MLKFQEALNDLSWIVSSNPSCLVSKQKYQECKQIVTRIQFERAIVSERTLLTVESILGDVEHISLDNYDGPKGIIDESFCCELMQHFEKQKKLHRKVAFTILIEIRKLFEQLPTLCDVEVPKDGTLTVCGDTHGQFYDVLNIFRLNGNPSPQNAYLFNGDFVDRGSFSVEVVFTLFAWKLCYPNFVHLTRGNHESLDMNRMYGFEGEVNFKFSKQVFSAFTEVFNAMPLSFVINSKIFVVHGGIPTVPTTLDEIRKIQRFKQPQGGIMSDLLWADPQVSNGSGPSKRGVGLQFGPDITFKFLELNNLDLIIRSHEVKQNGYEYQHQNKCLTIFSAPNYCDQVGNLGAFIRIFPNLELQIETFEAVTHPNVMAMAYSPLKMN